MNPCADKYATKGACDKSEFCHWSDAQDKCTSLSTDYAVRKMSVMREKVSRRFLELLQIAAIDCLVFRELHDDRSRACFTVDPDPTVQQIRPYRGFNESDREGSTTSARDSSGTDDPTGADNVACASITDEDTCHKHKGCYTERGKLYGFKCKNKESPSGANHQKCRIYYDDKNTCITDPLCKWIPTGSFRSNYTCQNRYSKNLANREIVGDFAMGLMANASVVHKKRHLMVYPMEEKTHLQTEKDIRSVLKHFKRRCSANEHVHIPLLNVLEELYELVEQDATIVKQYETIIRQFIQLDTKQNIGEWKANAGLVLERMDRIAKLYNTVKKIDSSKRDSTHTAKKNSNNHRADPDTPAPAAKEDEEDAAAGGMIPPYLNHTIGHTTRPAPDAAASAAPASEEEVLPESPFQYTDIRKKLLLSTHTNASYVIHKKKHDLLVMRNNGHLHFHYTFHIYFNNKHYFFDSSERRGAPVALVEIQEMKQIHKHIELLDLSLRVVFHVRHMKIYRVDLRVYVLEGGVSADAKQDAVRTIFVDKDSRRYHLMNTAQCDQLWEQEPALQHPMAFRCKRSTGTQKVIVDGSRLPKECPVDVDSGSLVLPQALAGDDATRIQTNHCYTGWMGRQKSKKKKV